MTTPSNPTKATFRVAVQLTETAQPIEHEAKNAYTKGGFYCVYLENGKVAKYPIANIWRVIEDYGVHAAEVSGNRD